MYTVYIPCTKSSSVKDLFLVWDSLVSWKPILFVSSLESCSVVFKCADLETCKYAQIMSKDFSETVMGACLHDTECFVEMCVV